MMDAEQRQLLERLVAMMSGAESDASIGALLAPSAADAVRPGVEALLALDERVGLSEDLRSGTCDSELVGALEESLRAVLPLLGLQPLGPPFLLLRRARQRYEAEARKARMVRRRLDALDAPAPRRHLLERYLSTGPAPLFVTELERRFAAELSTARRALEAGRFTPDELATHAGLLAWLREPGEHPAELQRALEPMRSEPELRALEYRAADHDERLLLAALAFVHGQTRMTGVLLEATVGARIARDAPQIAALAAALGPAVARSALSSFLFDMTWGNPEEPDAELTPERARAIVAARSLLPRLDSPLDDIDRDEISSDFDGEDLGELAERVRRLHRALCAVRSDFFSSP
jgi:hypothetical protein